jgi:hypothetical protein
MVAGIRDRTKLLQTSEARGTNSIITTAPVSLNVRPAFLCGEKTKSTKQYRRGFHGSRSNIPIDKKQYPWKSVRIRG